MSEEAEAVGAVKATISNLRDDAWALAQQYVMDQQPSTLALIRDLKERADLLAWSIEGRPKPTYGLDFIG